MIVKCNRIFSPITSESMGKREDMGKSTAWLTVGKEYVILALFIRENQGIEAYFQTDHYGLPSISDLIGFEFINQNIPKSWITVTYEFNGEKQMEMLPKNWNYDSFFEDVTEEVPKAIKLFNLEVQKMYQEEGLEFSKLEE